MSARLQETLLIVALLVATLIFWFWAIPASIVVMESAIAGLSNPGDISPRSIPQLMCGFIAVVLCWRLAVLIRSSWLQGRDDVAYPLQKISLRGFIIVSLSVLYAAIAVDFVGFYLAGFLFMVILIPFFGERRSIIIVGYPLCVLVAIYLIFGKIFHITLPAGRLLKPILNRIFS
jgi:hypothetical protein